MKQQINTITPLTLQSAARMNMQQNKDKSRRKRVDFEEWRTDSAAMRRQRRFAGLKSQGTSKPTKDSTTRTTHPRKLKATMQMQRRVAGMKHRAPRMLRANDFVYRTVYPTKLDALKIGKTKPTASEQTKDLSKLFRSVSEGAMALSSPHWTTSGGEGSRGVITSMSA